MAYQAGPAVCPQCGSSADVRTARELFEMMNGAQHQVFQRLSQFQPPGSPPGQWQPPGSSPGQWQPPGSSPGQWQPPGSSPGQFQPPGSPPGQWQAGSAPGQWQADGHPEDGDYDHYNVEGSDRQIRKNRGGNQRRRGRDFDFDGDSLVDDIGGAVLGAALGFVGRRMKKAFEERVIPAMQAKAAQAGAQFEQSKAEQEAIAARYPELRGCTRDQVIFVEGGLRTVPISEITMPVTLAQADSVVARLR